MAATYDEILKPPSYDIDLTMLDVCYVTSSDLVDTFFFGAFLITGIKISPHYQRSAYMNLALYSSSNRILGSK